jgi:hypothetical protein
MPAMADITVKKADGTTDQVYTGLNPSGGDDTWALWRSATTAVVVAARATCRLMSKWNAKQDTRRVSGKFLFPYAVTDSTTGVTSIQTSVSLEWTWQVPQNVPSAAVMDEAVAQGTNLVASTLIRACAGAGYAPQ